MLTPELSASLWALVPVVFAIASAWLIKEIIPYVKGLAAKVHLDIDAREDAQIQYVVEKWVRYAENVVENKYKDTVNAALSKGEEKMDIVVTGILDEIPGISTGQAEVLAEFVLNAMGHGAKSQVDKVKGKLEDLQGKLSPATVVVIPPVG